MNYNYHFVRVQHPDGVTYWTFGKWNTAQTITVTSEDLHIGDSSFTKDTVSRFDKNIYDLGNVPDDQPKRAIRTWMWDSPLR